MMNKLDQMKIALYYELLQHDQTFDMTPQDTILMEVLFDDPAIQKMFMQALDGLEEMVLPESFVDDIVDVTEDMVVASIPSEIMNIPDTVERELNKFLWATQERQKEVLSINRAEHGICI